MREIKRSNLEMIDGIQHITTAAYPYCPDDAGRANSKRPKQKNDCTVRALAIAKGWAYDFTYEELANRGRKCFQGFGIERYLADQAWAEKLPFPAVKGQGRMNIGKFCAEFKQGIFICKIAKHVFAVVDGAVHDTCELSPFKCVYTAWRIT